MEAAVKRQLKGRDPSEVTEINLDSLKIPTLAGIDEKFINLRTLSLIGVSLQSLEGFPKLPKLKTLILSDNKISGGLDHLVKAELNTLTRLDISNNRIQNLTTIEPLKSLQNLKHLDLLECDVCRDPNFPTSVFNLIPSLQTLNGADKNGEEIDEEEDEEDEEEGEGEGEGEGEEEEEIEEGEEGNDFVEEDYEEGSGGEGVEIEELGDEIEEEGSERGEVEEVEEEEEEYGNEGEEEEVGLAALEETIIEDDDEDGDYEPFDHRREDLLREEEDQELDLAIEEEEDEEEGEDDGEDRETKRRKLDDGN